MALIKYIARFPFFKFLSREKHFKILFLRYTITYKLQLYCYFIEYIYYMYVLIMRWTVFIDEYLAYYWSFAENISLSLE